MSQDKTRSHTLEDLLLTPEEAFWKIRVKRAKGYQLIASGELESIKIGRLRRIPVESLRKFVDSKKNA